MFWNCPEREKFRFLVSMRREVEGAYTLEQTRARRQIYFPRSRPPGQTKTAGAA
jgi:hypothetical protein